MLLAIDVGNTHTVAGVYQDATLLHDWRVSTFRGATVDELAAQHDQIMQLRGGALTDIDHMVIASVVPTLTSGYQELSAKYMDEPAVVIGPGVRTGMPLAIDNPHELGADRLVNAVAAYRHYQCACIVVDFGTATTFDCVSGAGEYLGGAIAPGIETSLDALSNRAARLLKVDLVPPARTIGKSTVESLQSGLIFGAVAMVDGMVSRLADEMGEEVAVVATGGLASLIAPLSEEIDDQDPLLTLSGLRIVHELTTQQDARPGRR